MKYEIRYQEIYQSLLDQAEESYQKFTAKLLPPESKDLLLGVRLPALRKMANLITKQERDEYLNYMKEKLEQTKQPLKSEEVMLYGFVIGHKKTWEEALPYVRSYVGQISNWSICDSFCTSLKIAKKQPDQVWNLIEEYAVSRNCYEIRFAVVMMLDYFIDSQHITRIYELLSQIISQEYYVEMAMAWCLSFCYIGFPKETVEFLQSKVLTPFVVKKTIQKIKESNQVTKEQKLSLSQTFC